MFLCFNGVVTPEPSDMTPSDFLALVPDLERRLREAESRAEVAIANSRAADAERDDALAQRDGLRKMIDGIKLVVRLTTSRVVWWELSEPSLSPTRCRSTTRNRSALRRLEAVRRSDELCAKPVVP